MTKYNGRKTGPGTQQILEPVLGNRFLRQNTSSALGHFLVAGRYAGREINGAEVGSSW